MFRKKRIMHLFADLFGTLKKERERERKKIHKNTK